MKQASFRCRARLGLVRLSTLALVAAMTAACASTGDSAGDSAEAKQPAIASTPDESSQAGSTEEPPSGSPEIGATLDDVLGSESERTLGATPPDGFEEIQWDDLVPPGFSQAEISARFTERMAEVEPGSPEAGEIYAELQAEFDNQPLNPEFSGTAVQLAGFVAPLTYEGELITEFLLVPYFGACIHAPPPPVNQTVMVTLQAGQALTVEDSWGAVWVTGTLGIDGAETDLATAGYSISNAQTGVYDDY